MSMMPVGFNAKVVCVTFQAHEVYEKGAALGLFRSVWQRSLYNVDRLQSRPWWTLSQTRSSDQFKVRSTFTLTLRVGLT